MASIYAETPYVAQSKPSSPCTIVDMPEVQSFNVHAAYNFFVPDERVAGVDTSMIPAWFKKNYGMTISDTRIEQLDNFERVPRFISFSYKPVSLRTLANISEVGQIGVLLRERISSAMLRSQYYAYDYIVKLSNAEKASTAKEGRYRLTSLKNELVILNNLDKIVSEEEFSGFMYMGLSFQDTKIDGKLHYMVSGSISSRLNGPMPEAFQPPTATQTALEEFAIDRSGMSMSDAAKFLNASTPSTVTGDIGLQALAAQDQSSIVYYNKKVKQAIVNNVFDEIKNVKLRSVMHGTYAQNMIGSSISNGMSLFTDELIPQWQRATSFKSHISNVTSQYINKDVSERTGWTQDSKGLAKLGYLNAVQGTVTSLLKAAAMKPVFVRASSAGASSKMPSPELINVCHMGYVIEKYEVVKKSVLRKCHPIVIGRTGQARALDFDVKYGRPYMYSIRAIYAIELPVSIAGLPDRAYYATYLVASSPSPTKSATIGDKTPPPPPADFSVTWDYTVDAPRLTWSFPPNPQRDITGFQVFRRANINSPFELIMMYDFDTSVVRTKHPENIASQLLKRTEGNQPVTYHIDHGMKSLKDNGQSMAIYAVCSVDPHGYTSGYSTQLAVRFDKYKNALARRHVSRSGAPKQYPNAYLETDLFVDTIRTSGADKVKVAFTPEYLTVYSANHKYGSAGASTAKKTNLHLIRTEDSGASYKMQLINVDLQKAQTIDIVIHNHQLSDLDKK